jgi:hypothetical protein
MVYSQICPFCERKTSKFRYDDDSNGPEEAEVSSGGRWGDSDLSTNMISYDELYTDDD